MPTSYLGQIYTANGHNLLTAVNGGGLAGNAPGVALSTDATAVGSWETFKLLLQPGSPPIGSPGMKFALQTSAGNYVTAINAGGVGGPNDATCPIHTDATIAGAWESFILQVDDSVNPPTVDIRTQTGNFVTAVNGGGVNGGYVQPIHTDATSVGTWEQFLFDTVAVVQPIIKSSRRADIGSVPVVSNETIRIVIEAKEPVLAGDFGEFLQLFERAFLAVIHDAVALSPILEIEQQQYADHSLPERLDNEFERLWDKLPERLMPLLPVRPTSCR